MSDQDINFKSKCGITDWNETIDILSDAKPIHHKASSKTGNGKARAYAIATDHANHGHYSAGAGASAAVIKDGDVEALIAESSAKADYGAAGAAGRFINRLTPNSF